MRMTVARDPYEQSGGDAAWRKWFDLCSVAMVRKEDVKMADGLAEQIASSMRRQLKGHVAEAWASSVSADDLVHHFDAYFILNGEKPGKNDRKPLKRWLEEKMSADGVSLKEAVCGMVLSQARGRVRNAVRDFIEAAKGWKVRSVARPEGGRKVVWDRAMFADEDIGECKVPLYVAHPSIGSRLDVPLVRKAVSEAIGEISAKMKLEKRSVALLFYVTAKGISMDTPKVLETLGVGKSRAYTLKKECMEMAETIFGSKDVETDRCQFVKMLLAECAKVIGDGPVSALAKNEEVM